MEVMNKIGNAHGVSVDQALRNDANVFILTERSLDDDVPSNTFVSKEIERLCRGEPTCFLLIAG